MIKENDKNLDIIKNKVFRGGENHDKLYKKNDKIFRAGEF